jgi:YebC/PmpR family DNA-binding regulatory protein
MSGHNKWSTIKRKKGAADAKRGQLFTRLTREIVMAAREGGGDPEMNFRLRLAVDKARAQNMPKDNIERSIKRGTGDLKDGFAFEQVMYEGYAPHGIAVLVECMTENRNRTVAEIRHILSRSGGNLGEAGSVSWQFTRQAYFSVPSKGNDFDKIFEIALDGGADDVTDDGTSIEIVAPVDKFKILSDKLRTSSIAIEDASLRMAANQEMDLGVDETLQVLKTLDALEELDDVQNVYSNLNISEEALAVLEED